MTTSENWISASYKEAMCRQDLWVPAIEVEYQTLIEKKCWKLVELLPEANIMGGRWTYRCKWDALGNLIKRKARYVGQGFIQILRIDHDKTYSAIIQMESVWMTLTLIAILGLHTFQLDFKSAYLNSPIEHNIYMRQPEGFVVPGKEHIVCKLKKTLYSTKQGAYNWYKTLSQTY